MKGLCAYLIQGALQAMSASLSCLVPIIPIPVALVIYHVSPLSVFLCKPCNCWASSVHLAMMTQVSKL